VRSGAAAGGDGSPASPFASIGEALAVAGEGAVVAIATGRYDEAVTVPAGVTLWGACAAETIITAPTETTLAATVVAAGDGVEVRQLTITGAVAGLSASAGSVTVSSLVVTEVQDAGIALTDTAQLVASDLVIGNVAAAGLPGESGVTIRLEDSSRLDLARGVLHDSSVGLIAGALGQPGGTDLSLGDVAFVDIGGAGLVCIGCMGRLERVVVEGARGAAFITQDSDLSIMDAAIRDVRNDPVFNAFGRAIFHEGGRLTAARITIERATEQAITVGQGTGELELSDALVFNTRSTEGELRYGRALAADRSGVARVSRAVFVENRDVAVSAFGDGSEVELTDVRVLDTRQRDCAATNCGDAPAGIGVGAYQGAHVRATRFLIGESALCGVQLAEGGSIDLDDGVVRGSPIGACVQVPDYDLSRLSATVSYRGNGANLQATELPVPEAGSTMP
jgi:hypothetical protein